MQTVQDSSPSNEQHFGTDPASLVTTTRLTLTREKPVHLIGIGGVGMSGLAEALLAQGFVVSGSDLSESPRTRHLRERSATVFTGAHVAGNVPEKALVVITSAVHADNPELLRAKALGLTICHRSALLQQVMESDVFGFTTRIGIVGSHGKTSTTGMVGAVLAEAGVDPTIIVGGRLPGKETNLQIGKLGGAVVAELDESDGSLVAYEYPTHTALLNLELDHPDHFKTLESLLDVFREYFANLKSKPGEASPVVLLNADCQTTASLRGEIPAHVRVQWISFTQTPASSRLPLDYWLENVGPGSLGGYEGDFHSASHGKLGRLAMQIPGRHNLQNGAVAAAIAHDLGLPFEASARAMRTFPGMGRRFERVGEWQGALLVDDYAHHPTEVAATLSAARDFLDARKAAGQPSGKLIAVFQPHRYSRFGRFWREFLASFQQADILIVTDVYAAHEKPLPAMKAEDFVVAMSQMPLNERPKEVFHVPGPPFDALEARLKALVQPGDLLMTLTAGDLTRLLREIGKK
jgi:UDP-N-acetylmuramate--alanine ligase